MMMRIQPIRVVLTLAMGILGILVMLLAGRAMAAGTGFIGDTVWYDANLDGVQNDDPNAGLANVKVSLYDITGTLMAATTTNANGAYGFVGLSAGKYRVDVDETTVPPGLSLTTDNEPLTVTLASGQAFLGADFGYALQACGGCTLGDRVWRDTDEDGVQDTGEPGIDNVLVRLAGDVDHDGIAEFNRATTTKTLLDQGGIYVFDLLPIGTYVVAVDPLTLPPAYLTPTYDYDGIATPHTATLTFNGETNLDVDFGYAPMPCGSKTSNLMIHGKKY